MHNLDSRIQAYLRAHATRMADHERNGPFLSAFDEVSDNPYRNYAVPDDGARPGPDDVAALEAAFIRRRRKPRLEYIAAAAPEVEVALLARGFAVEQRYPILTCLDGEVRDLPSIEIVEARTDADVVAAAEALSQAYGNDAPYPDPLRRLMEQGGVLAIVRDGETVVGAGMATPLHEGVTEVAGIGVRENFRRRGIAGALTAFLARTAFGRGATLAWLTPGSEGAERVYERAGFRRASVQIHISKEVSFDL
jgi:ribosomal protein S18 acetylase RimI-like enzyme